MTGAKNKWGISPILADIRTTQKDTVNESFTDFITKT